MAISVYANLINDLRSVDPTALHIVRTVLEKRVDSAVNKTDNLELRAEIARTYGLIAQIVEAVRNETSGEEITKVCKRKNE